MLPVRFSKEDLKTRFHAGERFAVRVLALQKKKVFLTEAVVEEALRRSELLEFLLSDMLLSRAEQLSDAEVKTPLTVVTVDEGKIIALAEELLAEEEPKALQKTDARFEFAPDQLDQFRLTLLTSVDPKQKIEALRKLAVSQASAEDKGLIFLRALNDPDGEVRREAIAALQHVGMSPDVAEALRAVGEGSQAQKRMALEKLAASLTRCSLAERTVAFSAILGQIRQESDVELTRALVEFLGRFTDLLRDSPDLRSALVRTTVKILTDRYHALSQPVLRLFEQIAPSADEAFAAALWKEVEPLSDRPLRALFLSVIGRMPHSRELRRTMAEAVARTLSVTHGEEIESRQFLDVGRMLGEEQVRAYLALLPGVKDEYLNFYISAIDFTADSTTLPEGVLNEVGRTYGRLLDSKGKVVRRAILECSLCHNPRLSDEVKEQLAHSFLSNLHLDQSGRIAEMTSAMVAKMGMAAVPALKEVLSKTSHDVERRVALELLGTILTGASCKPEDLNGIVKFLRKLEKNAAIPRGPLWVALGRVCANSALDAALAKEVFDDLRVALNKRKGGFDLILGMAHLAAAPSTPARDCADLVLDILQTLEGKLPDPNFEQQQTDEGVRLIIGNDALAYTEFIPNLLSAVAMLYESGKLPDSIRAQAVERLVKRWDDLIEFREIWAPGTIIDLARTFCAIARHASTTPEQRCALFEAILRYSRNTTICRILADGLAQTEEESDQYAAIIAKFAENLLDLYRHPDYQQAEDRRAIMAALGKTALNRRLAKTKKDSERLREQIVELMIEQSGPNQREVLRLLRQIAGSPHTSEPLRSRVQSVVEA